MKYRATNTNLYQYFRCMGCGSNLKSRIAEPKLKTKGLNMFHDMTDEQERHLDDLKDDFLDLIEPKYRAGLKNTRQF